MKSQEQEAAQFLTGVGLPVQARVFLLHVSGQENGVCTGRLHNLYQETPQTFRGWADAVLQMDAVMERFCSPQANSAARSVQDAVRQRRNDSASERVAYQEWLKQKPRQIRQFWGCESLQPRKDDVLTVYILVRFRQHSSWQGEVTWPGSKRKQSFRSVLELLHLLQSALTAKLSEGETEIATD